MKTERGEMTDEEWVDLYTQEVKSDSRYVRLVIALHSPDGNLQTGPLVSPPEKTAAELAFWV
jgi:hypothetical protein